MAFDVNGAVEAGYSPAEIADHLAISKKFDVAGAREAGYSEEEIVAHLTQEEEASSIPQEVQNLGAAARGTAEFIGGGIASAVGGGIAGLGAMAGEEAAGRPGERMQVFGQAMEDAGTASDRAFSAVLGDPSAGAKEVKEKLSQAFEYIRGKAGEGMEMAAPFTVTGQLQNALGIDAGASARGAGEMMVDLAPLPIGARAIRGAKPSKPTVSKFADLRESLPEIRNMTDEQIVEYLDAKNKSDTKPIGEQLDLIQDEPRSPEAVSAAAQEQARSNQAIYDQDMVRIQEDLTGQRDLFGEGREAPVFEKRPETAPQPPLTPEGAQGTPAPTQAPQRPGMALEGPAMEQVRLEATPYQNTFMQYFAERAPELIQKITESKPVQKLMGQVEELMERAKRAQELATQSIMRATLEGQGLQLKPKDLQAAGTNAARSIANHDWAQKKLTALEDELRQIADDHGWETKDVNTLSDWINDRRDSLGPRPDPFVERPLDVGQRTTDASRIETTLQGPEALAQREFDPWRNLPQVEKTRTLKDMNDSIAALKAGKSKIVPELVEAIQRGAKLTEVLDLVQKHGNRFESFMANVIKHFMHRDPTTTFGKAQKYIIDPTTGQLVRNTKNLTGETLARGFEAFYEGIANQIVFKDPSKASIHAILHEGMHAASHWAFVKYGKMGRAAIQELSDPRERSMATAVADMETVFNAFVRHMEKKGLKSSSEDLSIAYTMADGPYEMLSEIASNPKAIELLDRIPTQAVGIKSTIGKLGQYLIDAIRRVLGLQAFGPTIFSEMFTQGSKLLRNMKDGDQFYFDQYIPKEDIARMADPLVEQIRQGLPKSYKHLAEALAAEARESKPVRGDEKGPKGTDALEKDFLSSQSAWSEVREGALATADISGGLREKLGSMITPGRIYAWVKEHPTLKYIVDTVDTYKRNAEVMGKMRIVDPQHGMRRFWKDLSKDEGQGLMKTILDNNGVRSLSEDQLRKLGMNDKQIAAYENGRRHFDETLNDINAERVASGLKAVDPRPGYWPMMRKGNHLLYVFAHEGGPLLFVEPSNWKIALEHLGKKARTNGYHYEIRDLPRRGDVKDTYGLFNSMLDTIGRDTPEAGVARELMKTWKDALSNERRQFRQHFEQNRDLVGMKDYGTFLEAADGYFKDAYEYVYSRQASRQMNKLLWDKDLLERQPNVRKFAEHYWNNAMNWETPFARSIAQAVEWLPQHFGLDRDLPAHALHQAKQLSVMYMLGWWRGSFLLSQLWQPIQFMGPMLGFLEARSGIKLNTSLSMLEGTASANMAMLGGKLSKFERSMLDYAKAHNVIDPHFLEDMKSVGGWQNNNILGKVSGRWAMTEAEKYSRLMSFYQTAHALKRLGVDEVKIGNMAHNITDIAMTNYRKHERALMYGKLGLLGDAISPLTTFRHNYGAQLYKYGKMVATEGLKNPKMMQPLARMLVMQLVVAGSMGFLLRENIDHILALFRNIGLIDPKTRSLTQVMLETTGEIESDAVKNGLRYGVGGLIGVDVSPTFSASNLLPTSWMEQGMGGLGDMMAIANPITKVGGEMTNIIQQIGKGTITEQDWLALAAQAPGALKGVAENMATDSSGLLRDPNKDMAGVRRRTTADRAMRYAGARTVEESAEMTARAQNKLRQAPIDAAKTKLVDEATKLAMSGRPWMDQLNKYVELGGDPQVMIKDVRQKWFDTWTTMDEQEMMKLRKPKQGSYEQYQRGQQMR